MALHSRLRMRHLSVRLNTSLPCVTRLRPARPVSVQICKCFTGGDQSSISIEESAVPEGAECPSLNLLEQLRSTRDPATRARLLTEVQSVWSEALETYQPSPVELLLVKELGIWQNTVMHFALGNPDVATYDAATQAKPCIKALKEANIAPEDIWFLLTKRPTLLSQPVVVQRWLDFLQVYGLQSRDLQNFLLKSTDKFLKDTTLFAAGQVVSFLKFSLGIKDEFLSARVLGLWPQILSRDVEHHIRPIVNYLMSLGVEVSDIRGMVCAWPELLMRDVDKQLKPWAEHLKSQLGCSTAQVAEILETCPHLLGFKAEEVFSSRLSSLAQLGLTQQDIASMTSVSVAWLTSPGGITGQLDVLLKHAGFSTQQVRTLLLAAPDLLCEKDFELIRKVDWLKGVLHCSNEQIVDCPQCMGLGLMHVLGPRHGFLDKQGQLSQIMDVSATQQQQEQPGSQSDATSLVDPPTAAAAAGAAAPQPRYSLPALCLPADVLEWCRVQNISAMDFAKYRAHWEEEYTQGLVRSAAQEFQDELRKLGIYEGDD